MKVDVIELRGRFNSAQCAFAIEAMANHTAARGYDVFHPKDVWGSAQLDRARNLSLQKIRKDSDFVLFVDDDMIPVTGALNRLIDHDMPVVSALCVTRSLPPKIAAKRYVHESGRYAALEHCPDNTVMVGDYSVGAAFLLVKTAVIAQVIEFVLSGRDWLELNRKAHDRLKVRSENREAERRRIEADRRARYETEGMAPVFQFTLMDDSGPHISEDHHFCRLLHALGIPVAIDTGALVGHMGDFPYSPTQLGISHPSLVKVTPDD